MKMRFYRLSEQRVRRVLHSPKRVEEGIAPGTVAMMQPAVTAKSKAQIANGTPRETWTQEIWVMIQKKRQVSGVKRQGAEITKVISAWRYPGMTKQGEPLPPEILREMRSAL